MYDRATIMDAPNPTLSFSANILTFFRGNDWKMNVTENSVIFKGIAYIVFAFTNFEDVALTLERLAVVTLCMPPMIHNNPIINLFVSPM